MGRMHNDQTMGSHPQHGQERPGRQGAKVALFVLHRKGTEYIIYSKQAPRKEGSFECEGTLAALKEYCLENALSYRIAGLE